jgi:hypothetical protein
MTTLAKEYDFTDYSVKHSPTLNTVLMVEEFIRESKQAISVAKIKKSLPKRIMHSTLMQILEYLEQSGKILFTSKGIIWIFTERKELEKLKSQGLEL